MSRECQIFQALCHPENFGCLFHINTFEKNAKSTRFDPSNMDKKTTVIGTVDRIVEGQLDYRYDPYLYVLGSKWTEMSAGKYLA